MTTVQYYGILGVICGGPSYWVIHFFLVNHVFTNNPYSSIITPEVCDRPDQPVRHQRRRIEFYSSNQIIFWYTKNSVILLGFAGLTLGWTRTEEAFIFLFLFYRITALYEKNTQNKISDLKSYKFSLKYFFDISLEQKFRRHTGRKCAVLLTTWVGTEENNEKHLSEWQVSRPRFEPGNSPIRSTSADHPTATLGMLSNVTLNTR